MSVLIKGMTMPYGCWECPVAADHVYCKVLGKKTSADNERHIDCPMMGLPDHGDLIDRDALNATDSWEWIRHNAPVIIPAERSEGNESD